ncbi:hypothetical protein EJB05_08037, partial [Eragrostis curvula]
LATTTSCPTRVAPSRPSITVPTVAPLRFLLNTGQSPSCPHPTVSTPTTLPSLLVSAPSHQPRYPLHCAPRFVRRRPPNLINSQKLIEKPVVVDMGQIQYSEKYFDDTYEYRHVVLPPEVAKLLPKNRLLSENEWRAIGVQQSRGWVHYAIHRPEPHIMLFRRPLNYQQLQEAAAAAAGQMLPK